MDERTDVRLTRRDAVRALATSGVLGGTALTVSEAAVNVDSERSGSSITETEVATMKAAADVIYPSEVDASTEFIETYVRSHDDQRKRRVATTIDQLNAHTRTRIGSSFHELRENSKRETILRSMGVDRVHSSPDGTLPSRIRYHLVNSLLYALFTTPKGAELFGIRNPLGYAGGLATYREQFDDN